MQSDKELMQQALEGIDWLRHHLTAHHGCLHMDATASGIPAWLNKTETALRKRLAQPEQEPVAWMTFNAVGDEDDIWYVNPDGKLLEGWTYKPLYTAPRQWQSLTDEDREEILRWVEWKEIGSQSVAPQKLIAYVERKLREKNT